MHRNKQFTHVGQVIDSLLIVWQPTFFPKLFLYNPFFLTLTRCCCLVSTTKTGVKLGIGKRRETSTFGYLWWKVSKEQTLTLKTFPTFYCYTVFENYRKSLILYCERSELRLQFYMLSGQKFIKNAKNSQFWRIFENLKLAVKQCYLTSQI